MIVRTTGVVDGGLCEVKSAFCSAALAPGGITFVFLEDGRQCAVCGACLEHQIATGAWMVVGSRPREGRTGHYILVKEEP